MVWFRVDDGFYTHKKVLRIPREQRPGAIGTWTLCGTWSADKKLDGAIPSFIVEEIGASKEGAQALVKVKLWRKTKTGYAFVNWNEFQPTRSEISQARQKSAERMRRSRARSHENKGKEGGSGYARVAVQQIHVAHAPTRPDPYPTTPSPKELDVVPPSQHPRAIPSQIESAFESVWKFWPKSQRKQQALEAFSVAVKILGVSKASLSVKRFGEAYSKTTETRYVPMLHKWLGEERWSDALPEAQPEREWLTPAEKNIRKLKAEDEAATRGERTEFQQFMSENTEQEAIGK